MNVTILIPDDELKLSALHEAGHCVMANALGLPVLETEIYTQRQVSAPLPADIQIGDVIRLNGEIDTGQTRLGVTGGDPAHYLAVLFAGLLAERRGALSFRQWRKDYKTADDTKKVQKCAAACGLDDTQLEAIFNRAGLVINLEWESVRSLAAELYRHKQIVFSQPATLGSTRRGAPLLLELPATVDVPIV